MQQLRFGHQRLPAADELPSAVGAANATPAGTNYGFTWYYAILPQMEQMQIFNAVNFSLSPAHAGQVSAAITKINAMLCPSESANTQLFATSNVSTAVVPGSFYAVSNYVGNYGGPAVNYPYSGTIIPEIDVESNPSSVGAMNPVGMQSMFDGTSNTGLISERLLALYPYGGSATTVYPSGNNAAWRAVFPGTVRCRPSHCHVGDCRVGEGFVQGCNAILGTTASTGPAIVGVQMMIGHPASIVMTSYMHWTAPNTSPCANTSDAVASTYTPGPFAPATIGPWGSASASSLHSGGVNVCFGDGSVHFIKSSVALPTWWALGTRNGSEVVSSDQY